MSAPGPAGTLARGVARGLIRSYQLTVSVLVGRQCRYLPTCSDYTADAIGRHGVWAGGWMGTARLCRCHPWGAAGFDPVPPLVPPGATPWRPWRYGVWRLPDQDRASRSAASP